MSKRRRRKQVDQDVDDDHDGVDDEDEEEERRRQKAKGKKKKKKRSGGESDDDEQDGGGELFQLDIEFFDPKQDDFWGMKYVYTPAMCGCLILSVFFCDPYSRTMEFLTCTG